MEQNGTGVFTITRSTSNNAVAPQDGGSSDNLISIKTKSALLKKKSAYDRKFTIALFIICILLIIAVVIMAYNYVIVRGRNDANVKKCETEECIRSAANLKLSMDPTADPCDDFYQYTCGRWTSEHPDHGWFSINSAFALIEEKITFASLKFFQSNATEKEPFAVKQSRDMYQACMDLDAMNELGYAPIYKYLKQAGLPKIPTYLNMTDVDYSTYKYDWINTEVALTKLLAMPLFIGLSIEPNVYNTTENCIVLGVPDMESPLPSPLKNSRRGTKFSKYAVPTSDDGDADGDGDEDEDDDELVKAYTNFVSFVMKTVIKANATDIPDDFDDRIDMAVKIIVRFASEINSIHSKFVNPTEFYIPLTADEMQNATDNIFDTLKLPKKKIWEPFLIKLFNGTNVTLSLKDKDLIYVDPLHVKYLFMITGFVSAIPDVFIELWVWWMTVNALIINTTKEIREFYDKQSEPFKSVLLRTRSISCSVLVNEFMGMAVSYALADKRFLNDTKPKIEQMLYDIKESFAYRVKKINWMDDVTKNATLEKSTKMISYIGFPDWLFKEGELDKYYTGLVIHNDTHLENLMSMVSLYVRSLLQSLRLNNSEEWHSDPTTVNAYNFFLDNSITVPMAILFFPLYNLGLEVLNYGAIGSILGHELTHGFDNTGRKYDKYGNYRQWWTNTTVNKFENLTSCFVDQYKGYHLKEIDTNIDGELTLGENIADNGGLNHAFLAYKNYQRRNGMEPMLPGFEDFTHDQLFFIAFGSVWCDEVNAEVLSYQVQDVHCPNRIRVLGTLTNSQEFAQAFHCPVGSKMNPNRTKCVIW